MEIQNITFEVNLYDWQAYALATFCRRSVFEYFLGCTDGGSDRDEAYAMVSAITVIRHALATAMKIS